MTKKQATEILQALIDRIPAIDRQPRFNSDWDIWRHDVVAALKHIFPTEPKYIHQFEGISYSLGAVASGTPDSAWEFAFKGGLRRGGSQLQSRMNEVLQYWPDDDHVTEMPAITNSMSGLKKQVEAFFNQAAETTKKRSG